MSNATFFTRWNSHIQVMMYVSIAMCLLCVYISINWALLLDFNLGKRPPVLSLKTLLCVFRGKWYCHNKTQQYQLTKAAPLNNSPPLPQRDICHWRYTVWARNTVLVHQLMNKDGVYLTRAIKSVFLSNIKLPYVNLAMMFIYSVYYRMFLCKFMWDICVWIQVSANLNVLSNLSFNRKYCII